MQFQIPIKIPVVRPGIDYRQQIMLTGSCFTQHIGQRLSELKFNTLQNPNGILFDPISVCNSLISYMEGRQYREEELYFHQELYHSWAHHSRFSGPDPEEVAGRINRAQNEAACFLRKADWLIITLGSANSYQLVSNGQTVANCHKAPAATFNKHMHSITEIITALDGMLYRLFRFNPALQVIFTISPVRHIRDGIMENNRSKARLMEAVHHMIDKFDRLFYFPSYELVVDVLRDYRFYDIDLVHPNYAATQFVLENFQKTYMDEKTVVLLEKLDKIRIAKAHKPFHPGSDRHRTFRKKMHEEVLALHNQHPYLSLEEELDFFRED